MSAQTSNSPHGHWVYDAPRDLALFVATPLLVVPFALLFTSQWSSKTLVILVAAFGQLGHVLPGLIRAYGDRNLWDRFRTRLTVAPLLLGAACIFATFQNLHALFFVSSIWAIWHALMQSYGFVRIYGAKEQDGSKLWSHLDFAMCLGWFAGVIVINDEPLSLMLKRWYASGGVMISPDLIAGVQSATRVALAVLTTLYVMGLIMRVARGQRLPIVKLITLVSSVGFYWYAYAWTSSILVGAALFEIFHDVQYLSIVWLFNRKQVERQSPVTGLVRFLFRRSGALIGLYVGLVFAFGGLRFIEHSMSAGSLRNLLTSILATASLLHFYYDGFIWKVRESKTRDTLDIDSANSTVTRWQVPSLVHAAKWCVGVVPVLVLFASELSTRPDETTQWIRTANSMPDTVSVQLNASTYFQSIGETQLAEAVLANASKAEPSNLDVLTALARLQTNQGQLIAAETHLKAALKLAPLDAGVRSNLGTVLAMQGRLNEARLMLESSLRFGEDADAHFNLGNVLASTGDADSAADHYQRALELRPDFTIAHEQLRRTQTHGQSYANAKSDRSFNRTP